jgi:uncharacterized protein YegJ (DUF2314 family)
MNKNIRLVCPDCMEKKHAETQKKIALIEMGDFVGMFVKKSFSKGKRTEHLWLQVTGVNEPKKTLCGVIDNDPVIIKNAVTKLFFTKKILRMS